MKYKTIIITGGTKGMGYACSRYFLEKGANVTMVYANDDERAQTIAHELSAYKDQIHMMKADITKEKNRAEILSQTVEKFKHIDVLLNNAGISSKHGFLKMQEDAFDRVIDVNLKAPIFLAKAVAQHMIDKQIKGSIINIASVAGHRAMGGISYDASKAGLINATRGMAQKLGKYGIRVNSISPGTHKTEMNRHNWVNETELHKKMTSVTALKRAAEASEIVGTAFYLASDASSYTTGIDIIVDGGYLSHCPGR